MVVKNCMLVCEGGLSKNFGHHGWSARNDFKITLIKTSSNSPKKLDQKISDSEPHIWTLFLNFRFSSRKYQSKQKTSNKCLSFYNTVSFEKPKLTQRSKKEILS